MLFHMWGWILVFDSNDSSLICCHVGIALSPGRSVSATINAEKLNAAMAREAASVAPAYAFAA